MMATPCPDHLTSGSREYFTQWARVSKNDSFLTMKRCTCVGRSRNVRLLFDLWQFLLHLFMFAYNSTGPMDELIRIQRSKVTVMSDCSQSFHRVTNFFLLCSQTVCFCSFVFTVRDIMKRREAGVSGTVGSREGCVEKGCWWVGLDSRVSVIKLCVQLILCSIMCLHA